MRPHPHVRCCAMPSGVILASSAAWPTSAQAVMPNRPYSPVVEPGVAACAAGQHQHQQQRGHGNGEGGDSMRLTSCGLQ